MTLQDTAAHWGVVRMRLRSPLHQSDKDKQVLPFNTKFQPRNGHNLGNATSPYHKYPGILIALNLGAANNAPAKEATKHSERVQ